MPSFTKVRSPEPAPTTRSKWLLRFHQSEKRKQEAQSPNGDNAAVSFSRAGV